MKTPVLPRRTRAELTARRRTGLTPDVLETARAIVEHVRRDGEPAVREYAERFHEIGTGDPLLFDRPALQTSEQQIAAADRDCLARLAQRVERFATAQRQSIERVDVKVVAGRAGHRVVPVEHAGCYAPGGRYPLPSSVIMTAVTARVAGVSDVWVASPKPTPHTLAAASLAGADGVLAAGGAHAIAALAFGMLAIPACDVIVGPGNVYVTAAKKLLAGDVRIDMLAGPSELVILADELANPHLVAADLLAQAEHAPDAFPVLVSLSDELIDDVEVALRRWLADLPTAEVACAALQNGGAVFCTNSKEAADLCNALAPEHVHVVLHYPTAVMSKLNTYGALFIGESSAEVFGDYGVGPNHVLPTGGTARSCSGLSVINFLRFPTWVELSDAGGLAELVEDVARLARIEGLEAHARAAEARR